MSEKRIILVKLAVVMVVVIAIFGGIYHFFSQKFTSIEKKQDELLAVVTTGQVAGANTDTEYSDSESSSYALTQELGRLRKKIVVLENQVEEHDDLLGFMDATESATEIEDTVVQTPLQFVTIADPKWKIIDVFHEKNSSSAIVGQAIFGQAYEYSKKEGDYYYIKLNDKVDGWIHRQFVKEY